MYVAGPESNVVLAACSDGSDPHRRHPPSHRRSAPIAAVVDAVRPLRVPPLRTALVRAAQRAAVAAGTVAPIARAMHGVYAFGLRVALRRLRRHPAIHSIYGCG